MQLNFTALQTLFTSSYMENKKSMVLAVSEIMTKNETFLLNQNMTCPNHGIYVANSVICHLQYVSILT